MRNSADVDLVSVHGGHSAQFCSHARDSLAEVIAAYAEQGFAWVGITEHMPAVSEALVPIEEREAGLDARGMYERFADYVATCRALQRRVADRLDVLVGFETETCTGSLPFVARLIDEFEPDYVVGSVHHVADTLVDASPDAYAEAAERVGGVDALYAAYLDEQYAMIRELRPAVVGHFDLIRLLDADYAERLQRPDVWRRVERNLQAIRELELILDVNVRALSKGQAEPYVSRPILERARELGIAVAPGDDSHGVADVGRHVVEGVRMLRELGFDTRWRRPAAAWRPTRVG